MWRTSTNGCFWLKQLQNCTALFLRSENLTTGYEQLGYYQFNRNLSICVSLAKYWFMLHEKFNQEDLAT